MKVNINLPKSIRYAFYGLLLCQWSLPAAAQTLQSVTDAPNGNYTTKNIWIGMSPAAGVAENALNIGGGGKIKLLGTAGAYTLLTDANQPTIYRGGINTGTYPFNNYDHLVLQAGIQNRDILLVTGSTPTPRLVVTGTGNVGIGTATPTALLNVNGGAIRLKNPVGYPYGVNIDVDFPGTWVREYSLTHGATGKMFAWGVYGNGSTLNYAYIGGNSTSESVQGAPWMTFTPNGNVGVGTINPQAKLAVNGDIFSKRVKVIQTGWADFVFHPDYKLPSLQEVEMYIKTNQHLPDIPAAAEVEKEGLDLGDMNKKLLQKVEELTLYLINQQKQIDELKQQNEMLLKRQ